MSEIDKKFSDFQKNECDEIVAEQPIDVKICPSCFPDPNFALPDYWYNIEEAYLNEKVCEYHVRVYESDAKKRDPKRAAFPPELKNLVLEIGVERILIEFDKLLNTGTFDSLMIVASIAETHLGTNDKELGTSYLISVPSFNFDAIPDLEDEEDPQDDEITPPDEFLVNYKGFFKKTIQLGGALRVYSMFYSAAHQIGDNKGITLVYEDDPISRLDYLSIRKSLIEFRRLLNITLRQNGFQGVDYPSLIRKRFERMKFVLNKEKPFVLESIYVLDENCGEEYVKLKINGDSRRLLKSGFETVVAFLSNLDSVINDITAKETKPWLEFSLDNIYPPLVANYGDYEKITEEDYRNIGCLFESSLGIGSGQVTNFLAKETLSFFKVLENDAYKSACRSINKESETKEKSESRPKTSEDLRKERTTSKYKETFINNYYTDKIKSLQQLTAGLSEDNELRNINRKNFWDKAGNLILAGSISELYQGPKYNYKNDKKEKKEGPPVLFYKITSRLELESSATEYADTRYELMENAWGSRFKNNEDWEEMKESYNEAFNPENGFLNYLFGTDAEEDDKAGVEDERTLLNTIGLCGMTKLTGKILKCLLGGVTIEDFYDLMAEKALEFMDVNTFDLFLNGLPLSFRDNLNAELSKQFGSIDLQQLIGIKSQDGSSMKDIVGFSKPNAIMKAFERSADPLRDQKITRDDKEFIRNNIGDGQFYTEIRFLYKDLYDRDESTYINNVINEKGDRVHEGIVPSTLNTSDQKIKQYKTSKKYIKKFIKHARRSYLKGTDTFAQANNKLKKTLDLFGEYDRGDSEEKFRRSLNSNERVSKALNQSNIGVKTDAIFDVVFDYTIDYILDLMNVDQLIQILNKFPGADLAVGFITDFLKSCPHPPLFNPPASDFMKSFSLDVCDPEINMKMPKINFPSLSLRYNLEKQFGDNFRNAIVSVVTKIAIRLLKRVMNFLEDALCKTLGAVGAFVAEGVQNGDLIQGAKDNFEKALDALFCGGSVNPDTGKSRASELANGLFQPTLAKSASNYDGAGDRVSNIISSVVSQDEIMRAVIDGDDRTNKMIANAINALSPEMAVLLGTPSQVATFFRNLKSYLPDDDRTRIRDMLDAGIPNLPLTSNICLTNDQLKAWNDLRNALLQDMGLTPEQAADKVSKLNEEILEALEQTIGDSLELDNPDGPFVGAITDEALKDACNPDNVFNDVSQSELSRQESQSSNEEEFDLILRLMMFSFNGRNGIFGNAMRARDNSREGIMRGLKKFFNSNYQNAQTERDSAFDSKGVVGKAIMNSLTATGSVIGEYPSTVGNLLRDKLLVNQTYDFLPSAFSTVFEEDVTGSAYFKSRHKFQDIDAPNEFSYKFRMIQKAGTAESLITDYTLPVNYSITEMEREYLESINSSPESVNGPLRLGVFDNIINSTMGTNKSHAGLYTNVFKTFSSSSIEATVTNHNNPGSLSSGYLFGYKTEDIVKEDFEYLNPDGTPYNKSENEKILGYYDHDRIKVLSPEIYGGRYSNPPYTVEPRKFVGWLEFATKAFMSQDGCDPKSPPMFSLSDIKERVDFLEDNLRNYPELTKDKDCVFEKPFKLLINNKTQAKMDGVVRTTIRVYVGEYFLRGIGTFSNVHLRPENYDQSFSAYIARGMKREMFELGAIVFNSRKSMIQDSYWYAFLEQSVQSYQHMYDLGEVAPPPHVLEALEEISLCQQAYMGITRSVKKRMKNIIDEVSSRPSLTDRKKLLNQPAKLAIYAMDFKLAEDKDAYFGSGAIDDRLNLNLIKRASLKKIKYFSKLFTIRMYEKEATIVMAELIGAETARLTETAFDGLNDKPKIWDVNKSFVGIKEIFENTNSNVGLNSYYSDKQRGTADPGDIPDIVSDISSAQVIAGENAKFIVEKYIRSTSKDGIVLPILDGVNSLSVFKTEVRRLSGINPDGYLSDYFGDLKFTYSGKFRELMDKGFANTQSIVRLSELNNAISYDQMLDSLNSYIGSQPFEDFNVIYDDSFLIEGEEPPEPEGTTGDLDINYGLRISMVMPTGHMSTSEIPQSIKNKALSEKSFVFADGTIVVPLVSVEVSAVDQLLSSYNPQEQYDLECLINKMVGQPDFTILFNKIFPLQMFNSMSAIFNSENFLVALGRGTGYDGVTERTEEALAVIEAGLDPDDWEGVSNEFLKNFLRRSFRSAYFSNDIDGFSLPDISFRERTRLFGSFNPFDIFALPSVKIPWFRKRRLKTKVYDAFGNECADPTKDFE